MLVKFARHGGHLITNMFKVFRIVFELCKSTSLICFWTLLKRDHHK